MDGRSISTVDGRLLRVRHRCQSYHRILTDINVRKKSGEHGLSVSIYTLSIGHIPRKLARIRYDSNQCNYAQYSTYNYTPSVHLSPPRPNLEELVSKYIDSANTGVKRMEAVMRSQTASLHNIENQIEQLARMIIEKPPSNAPSNMTTLRDVEEQVLTFPMFMDDKDGTAYELEESTPQRFQEPLLNTSVVEESKKIEFLTENKNEYEKGELEKENESSVDIIEVSERVNPLTHETNFVLVVDSLCMQESWKQPKRMMRREHVS
ncbi:hypothetical protein M9H77_36047 [Catharanthus roseus]|uniref:Uncharacterized protein n=1 Tax=Catharanthus roseus TaxID=4058 RepID=A0ACB9ZUZ6_CATRO|nr:hypothetical protein M9H77_36047 [Catharanthus roseus]